MVVVLECTKPQEGECKSTFVPGTDQWYVVWMMAGAEGYSELTTVE
jgi:hypothetical protein